MNKENILKKINDANDDLIFEGFENLEIYIAGGSGISLQIEEFRETSDIDLVKTLGSEEVRKICTKYEINDHLANSWDNFVEYFGNYKRCSSLVLDDKNKWYVIWPELIILNKMNSSREKDLLDTRNPKVLIRLNTNRVIKAGKAITEHWVKRYGPNDSTVTHFLNLRDDLIERIIKCKKNQ